MGNGSRFAACAVPSELTSGFGIAVARFGTKFPSDVDALELDVIVVVTAELSATTSPNVLEWDEVDSVEFDSEELGSELVELDEELESEELDPDALDRAAVVVDEAESS